MNMTDLMNVEYDVPILIDPTSEATNFHVLRGSAAKADALEVDRRNLIDELKLYLMRQGHEVKRLVYRPSGEIKPILNDLYIEAKGFDCLYQISPRLTRESIRIALGECLDFTRFTDAKAYIVTKNEPREDLVKLCLSQNVGVIFKLDGEFRTIGFEESDQ